MCATNMLMEWAKCKEWCLGLLKIYMSKRTSLLATSIFTSSSAIVTCAFLISIFKNKKHRSVSQDWGFESYPCCGLCMRTADHQIHAGNSFLTWLLLPNALNLYNKRTNLLSCEQPGEQYPRNVLSQFLQSFSYTHPVVWSIQQIPTEGFAPSPCSIIPQQASVCLCVTLESSSHRLKTARTQRKTSKSHLNLLPCKRCFTLSLFSILLHQLQSFFICSCLLHKPLELFLIILHTKNFSPVAR